MTHNFVYSLFLIFSGAALISTAALYTRQSLLVAYMLLGLLLGPYGFKLVNNALVVQRIGEVGIIFLLFLLGLELQPQKFLHTFKKVSLAGVVSAILFFIVGFVIAHLFGFTMVESIVIGLAMIFSSTIIGIKLLPTTALHHQHIGELMIGVLLFQDILAILILMALHAVALDHDLSKQVVLALFAFPSLILFAFLFERYILMLLLKKFNRIKEYLFLVAIAWCLSMAEFAHVLKLSAEMGAFIAGVSLATSPIAVYIAESLKPVRDFFLVLFFFSVGASFNTHGIMTIAIPAVLIAAVLTVLKPVVYHWLFRCVKEPKSVSWQAGTRLGQNSEFSLIIAFAAFRDGMIQVNANTLIQAIAMLTFIISSYIVVMKYPTPVALSDRLRQD